MFSAMVPKTLIFLCRVVGFSFLSVKKNICCVHWRLVDSIYIMTVLQLQSSAGAYLEFISVHFSIYCLGSGS